MRHNKKPENPLGFPDFIHSHAKFIDSYGQILEFTLTSSLRLLFTFDTWFLVEFTLSYLLYCTAFRYSTFEAAKSVFKRFIFANDSFCHISCPSLRAHFEQGFSPCTKKLYRIICLRSIKNFQNSSRITVILLFVMLRSY